MCYSILYFKPSTEKNDRSVVLRRLNPEGPLGGYPCDLTLPARLIKCQFLLRSNNKTELSGDREGGIILSIG